MKNQIKIIEDYVNSLDYSMASHGLTHVDRVKRWGLKIARAELFDRLDLVEAACLLHDIGRTQRERDHGDVSAEMAGDFLSKNNFFNKEEIDLICDAIRAHNKKLPHTSALSAILMDADILDLLGPMGVIRCGMSRPDLPEYDDKSIKGDSWRVKNDYYNERFTHNGSFFSDVVDHLNFQASCFDNITTKTAKEIARPWARFIYSFIENLEKQVKEGEK